MRDGTGRLGFLAGQDGTENSSSRRSLVWCLIDDHFKSKRHFHRIAEFVEEMKELFQEISSPPQPLEEIRDEPAERFHFSFRSLRLYEMRLMEHHDIPQMAKRDDSAQSSPVPTPSPPPHNIRLNTTRHLTTMFNDVQTGRSRC